MKAFLDIILREHSTHGNLNNILKSSKEHSSINYLLHDDGYVYIHDKHGVHCFCSAKNLACAMNNVHYRNFDYLFGKASDRIIAVRCKTCGAVTFVDNPQDALYHVKCPECGPVEQNNTFWTAEEIQADKAKRHYIRMLEKFSRVHRRISKRYAKTHLSDSEAARWSWFSRDDTRHIYFALCCDGLIRYGLRGLYLNIDYYKGNTSGVPLLRKGNILIPLSVSAVHRYWIIPHTQAFKNAMSQLTITH